MNVRLVWDPVYNAILAIQKAELERKQTETESVSNVALNKQDEDLKDDE